MKNTNVIVLSDDQFRVLYEILNDVYPLVKDPEPAFLELFNYVTDEYEALNGEWGLSPAVKAFSKVYPENWSNLVSKKSKEWLQFQNSYELMLKAGIISEESNGESSNE
jgi:hypothetical protein